MQTFLVKTEPEEYSIDDLARERVTIWNGVRNPVAVKNIRLMHPGDRVLVYHSGRLPGVVGLAQVINNPAPATGDPKSWEVELRYLNHFDRPILLRHIKAAGYFEDWALVRQGRLSVMTVPEEFLVWMIAELDRPTAAPIDDDLLDDEWDSDEDENSHEEME